MSNEGKFFYSNGLEVAVSPFDFNLKFLRQGAPENAEAGKLLAPSRLDEIIVAMSPSHAKAMLAGLYSAVMDYETNIGPITISNEDQKKFNETFGPILKK